MPDNRVRHEARRLTPRRRKKAFNRSPVRPMWDRVIADTRELADQFRAGGWPAVEARFRVTRLVPRADGGFDRVVSGPGVP